MARSRTVVVAWAMVWAAGCNPFRPSCSGESGPVTSLTGTVDAARTVVHRMPYGAQGSQNNITVSCASQGVDGPQFYATLTSCEDFSPATASGACQVLTRGSCSISIIITHGQGNPERLGTPPEYLIWVVGDPLQATTYTITATWHRPVEC